jgi:cysteinyl-tRNA synthetase
MEWDSPWGRGAPGWHLECSVMSGDLLGFPFDIHTGGIDHREIHHPNEIAQNQAFCHSDHSGARMWMHNNFLIERSGKMSKSAGEFLRVQLLIDKGFHPLAYRLMCLQAHYRSELEFSWEGLQAAFTRLKRMVMAVAALQGTEPASEVTDKRLLDLFERFDERANLRVQPKNAQISATEIEAALTSRKEARANKDFAASDAIRDDLIAKGVEVMDGDPLGWDWRIEV